MNVFLNRFSRLFVTALFLFFAAQLATAQASLSAADKQTIAEFEKRVNDYVKLRAGLEKRLPKLPKDATAEQIKARKAAFQQSVRAARRNSKQGEIFTPGAAALIRKILKTSLPKAERSEIRQNVLESDTKGVTLKVNAVYPDTAEQVEMAPELLMNLPQLPKELRYRFVGQNFLLMDRDNELILDYMSNALP